MDVSLFDFELPEDRIALRPANPRDAARMLVVHADGRLEHRHVRDLPEYLRAGDAALLNDTRVIPARLFGQRLREAGPAKIEILLHRRLGPDRYSVLARPARKLAVGDALQFGALAAEVAARGENGEAEIRFALSGAALDAAVAAQGEMNLSTRLGDYVRPQLGRDGSRRPGRENAPPTSCWPRSCSRGPSSRNLPPLKSSNKRSPVLRSRLPGSDSVTVITRPAARFLWTNMYPQEVRCTGMGVAVAC